MLAHTKLSLPIVLWIFSLDQRRFILDHVNEHLCHTGIWQGASDRESIVTTGFHEFIPTGNCRYVAEPANVAEPNLQEILCPKEWCFEVASCDRSVI